MQHNIIKTLCLPVLLICLMSACKEDSAAPAGVTPEKPKADTVKFKKASLEGAATYTVTSGTVYWSATKSIGKPHNGEIKVQKGELLVNEGQILKGKVVMDMNSIVVTNLDDSGERTELENHLKHSDFFDVKKYPTGEFVFADLLPNKTPDTDWVAEGKLTLKGKTKGVNIPVKVTYKGDEVEIESPSFSINRTDWGINFNSSLLGTAKDKLIEDGVLLVIRLKAKKN